MKAHSDAGASRDAAAPQPSQAKTIPYVAPFALFILCLGVRSYLPIAPEYEYPARVLLVSIALAAFSRPVLDLRVSKPLGSVAVGLLVFAVWIAPDLLWPGYRQHWLFQNSLTTAAGTGTSEAMRQNVPFLAFRVLGSVALVPVIEELFWRGWLMRYLIAPEFGSIALGTYAPLSFWLTAVLFASEHGPYWDVGLLAGVIYNAWLVRTRRLGDCILAHAGTNGALAAYVLCFGKWNYWL